MLHKRASTAYPLTVSFELYSVLEIFEQKLLAREFKKAVMWVIPASRTDPLGDKSSASVLFTISLVAVRVP